MKKILILMVGIIFLLLVVRCFIFFNSHKLPESKTQLYQGPIQEGYNETLFRETGIYKKINKENE